MKAQRDLDAARLIFLEGKVVELQQVVMNEINEHDATKAKLKVAVSKNYYYESRFGGAGGGGGGENILLLLNSLTKL